MCIYIYKYIYTCMSVCLCVKHISVLTLRHPALMRGSLRATLGFTLKLLRGSPCVVRRL